MPHTSRIVVIRASGARSFCTAAKARVLIADGMAISTGKNQITVSGEAYEWRGRQSGAGGPTVMQRIPLHNRRRVIDSEPVESGT